MTIPETETLSLLESHIIFHGVPEQDLSLLYPFLEFDDFPGGTAIVKESTQGNSLYVITSGSAAVVKQLSGDDNTMLLATLSQGDCFGEMELLDTMERSASVVAQEDTKCLVLTTGTLMKIYDTRPEAYPIIILNIARELSRRLRIADTRIAELEEEVVCLRDSSR